MQTMNAIARPSTLFGSDNRPARLSSASVARRHNPVSLAATQESTLRIGSFLIGAVEDPALWGHPDVRY